MANVAKYGKPEEMEKRIDEYFAKFEKPEPLYDKSGFVALDKQGKPVYREELPTSAGLAYFLGFESRCSLWEYEQKPTFARVVKRAKLRLQKFWEPVLATKNSAGAVFWLSNIKDDWRDVKQIEDMRDKAPKTALVVYVNAQTKSRKAAEIPTIEAEVVGSKTESATDAVTIAKPKKKVSHGKKLGRPKKSAKAKKTAKSTE